MVGRTNRVGDALIAKMREENIFSACTLDGIIADVGTTLALPLWKGMNPHPLNYARVAMSWLRRDDRFTRGLIYATDALGRARKIQVVFLVEEYR